MSITDTIKQAFDCWEVSTPHRFEPWEATYLSSRQHCVEITPLKVRVAPGSIGVRGCHALMTVPIALGPNCLVTPRAGDVVPESSIKYPSVRCIPRGLGGVA